MCTIQDVKKYVSVPGKEVTLQELKALSPDDRKELRDLLHATAPVCGE